MSQSRTYIDIGNSAVKWRTNESEVFSKNIDGFSIKSLPNSDVFWISSVAYPDTVNSIKKHFTNVHEAQSLREFGKLVLSYDDPSGLGVDRFLAMLGAQLHFPSKDLLIIDVGSAITFDVIKSSGHHQGGLIMPGLKALRLSFKKFSTSSQALESFSIKNNTKEAWSSGTHAMLLASINQQNNEFKLKYPDGEVLISGGIVKEILKDLPKSINYIDNLVLDGLESYSEIVG